MGAADQLNAFRRGFPDCRVAVFADMSSGLVLSASTDRNLPQENLDALCERARSALTGGLLTSVEVAIGGPIAASVTSEDDKLYVFVRSETEPDEVFACECAPDVDLFLFLSGASGALAAIGSSG